MLYFYTNLSVTNRRGFLELTEDIETEYAKIDPLEVRANLFVKESGYLVSKIDEQGRDNIYEIYLVHEVKNEHAKPQVRSGINMSHLQMAKRWTKENTTFTVPDISAAVAEIAVHLSEGYLPHFFDFVLVTFTSDLIRHPKTRQVGGVQMIDGTLEEIVDIAHNLLMTNKSFREWNLTTLEAVNHINVDDDEQRAKAGLFEKSDKKFIDLEAFRQNLYRVLRSKMIEDWFFEAH